MRGIMTAGGRSGWSWLPRTCVRRSRLCGRISDTGSQTLNAWTFGHACHAPTVVLLPRWTLQCMYWWELMLVAQTVDARLLSHGPRVPLACVLWGLRASVPCRGGSPWCRE